MLKKLFYILKPLIPRKLQIFLRRQLVKYQRKKYKDVWPVLPSSAASPDGWNGWPIGKRFAFILTHDVELQEGHDKCKTLLHLEKDLGFKSSFNFVPERYFVDPELRKYIVENGFEVGVHGLNHDGKLYSSKEEFLRRAKKINQYIAEWQAVGFRSPAMHHNLEWLRHLNVLYDASTFDTDPFEPQADGVGTIFPFWVDGNGVGNGYVELPYTLVQDFTLFITMNENNIEIWKKKLDWIAEHGGMALINVHPDYIYFGDGEKSYQEFPKEFYIRFLEYVRTKYDNQYWHVLPKELALFYKNFHFNKKIS